MYDTSANAENFTPLDITRNCYREKGPSDVCQDLKFCDTLEVLNDICPAIHKIGEF